MTLKGKGQVQVPCHGFLNLFWRFWEGRQQMAKLCPLFSGSSGNSIYVGNSEAGILVDAGRSARQLAQALGRCGIPIAAVKAVFVTHEHVDHVKGLRVFAERNRVPVYSSPGTLCTLEENGCLTPKISEFVAPPGGVECAGMMIRPFHMSHDCAEGVGYKIFTGDDRKISTDLGYISDEVMGELETSDLVVLESNHDVGMLQNGPYPYPLKRRILSDVGHLSNAACAEALPGLAEKGATRFVLAHLSAENNTPELAYQTALCSLTMAGFRQNEDFQLTVAPRVNETGKILLF